jgi:hypothetical protein
VNLKIVFGLFILIAFVVSYNLGLIAISRKMKNRKNLLNIFGKIKKINSYEFWMTDSEKYQQLSDKMRRIEKENGQEDEE